MQYVQSKKLRVRLYLQTYTFKIRALKSSKSNLGRTVSIKHVTIHSDPTREQYWSFQNPKKYPYPVFDLVDVHMAMDIIYFLLLVIMYLRFKYRNKALPIDSNMKSTNNQSQGDQASSFQSQEGSKFQRLIDKYQGMLLEDAQSLTRARSFAASTMSWLLIATKALLPLAYTHLRNFYVLRQAAIVVQPVLRVVTNWPFPCADSFACLIMVAMLSWLWWLCRQSFLWLVFRILLWVHSWTACYLSINSISSLLANATIKLIPIPTGLISDAVTVAIVFKAGTALLFCGGAYLIYGTVSILRQKSRDWWVQETSAAVEFLQWRVLKD